MGVALYVQGYQKEPSCISGELKVLGWYEVDSGKIYKHKIPGAEIVIHSDMEAIKLVKKEFYDHGFIDEAEFLFFDSCINNMSGWGIRSEGDNTYVLAFDAKKILTVIDKVLVAIKKVESRLKSADKEREELLQLKSKLELIANSDGIVEMTMG